MKKFILFFIILTACLFSVVTKAIAFPENGAQINARDLPQQMYTKYDVEIRLKPKFEGKLVMAVGRGTVFRVLEGKVFFGNNVWYRVQNKGRIGWAHSDWITDDPQLIKKIKAENKKKLEIIRARNKKKIAKLEVEAGAISASHIYENIRIYRRLLKLDPNNQKYKEKVAFYESKLNQEKSLCDLELLDWVWNHEYGYVTAEGRVKNISGKKLNRVQAIVVWYDKNGQMITYDSSFIEYNPVMPGQISPFKVIERYNPAMARATIEFKYFGGTTIRTYHDR